MSAPTTSGNAIAAEVPRLSAILPLKLRDRYYGENFERCRLLFGSLTHFAAPDLFERILVVVPAEDRRKAEQLRTEFLSLPVEVENEEAFLPSRRPIIKTHGYFRQQVIKLWGGMTLGSDFVLTLDPDLLLCKPLARGDLFVDGRALLETDLRDRHPDWWTGSARLLGLPLDLTAPGMFVTPALLAREICQRSAERLEAVHQRGWVEALLRNPWRIWGEYALYYLMAEHLGLLHRFHIIADRETPKRITCASCVWGELQFEGWDLDACFDPAAPGYFTVMQSSTRISVERVRARLAGYLPA
ncbi:MAG TPA: DUF6492 family protein [Stellaceae bacterium]|nr:DUF6492 family protein [Stellaceae bacterium]